MASPRHSGWGIGVCVSVCAVCSYPANSGWGLWCVGWVLPGTCSRAVVLCMLCALPGFAAPGSRCCLAPVRVPWLWPAAVSIWRNLWPRLVRRTSSSLVPLGAPIRFPDIVVPFVKQGECAPDLLAGCAGHVEAGRKPGSWCLPHAPAEARALKSLGVVPVRGPAIRSSLAGPSGVGLGLCALRLFALCGPGHSRVPFPDQSVSRLVHLGCLVWTRRPPLSGQRTPRPGLVRVGVCVLLLAGRASQLPGGDLLRLTFPVAIVCLCFVFSPPPGLGLPCFCLLPPWLFVLCSFFFFFFAVVPVFPSVFCPLPRLFDPPCLSWVFFTSALCVLFFFPGSLPSPS